VPHVSFRLLCNRSLWALAGLLLLLVAGSSARDLDQDLDDTWETVGGDVVRKLVTDLENDSLAAGPKLVSPHVHTPAHERLEHKSTRTCVHVALVCGNFFSRDDGVRACACHGVSVHVGADPVFEEQRLSCCSL